MGNRRLSEIWLECSSQSEGISKSIFDVQCIEKLNLFLKGMAFADPKKVIYAAIAANLAIAGCKYVAAVFTKSSAMMAEAVHSTADTGNELLLLLGMKRSARPQMPCFPMGMVKSVFLFTAGRRNGCDAVSIPCSLNIMRTEADCQSGK